MGVEALARTVSCIIEQRLAHTLRPELDTSHGTQVRRAKNKPPRETPLYTTSYPSSSFSFLQLRQHRSLRRQDQEFLARIVCEYH